MGDAPCWYLGSTGRDPMETKRLGGDGEGDGDGGGDLSHWSSSEKGYTTSSKCSWSSEWTASDSLGPCRVPEKS